MGLTTKSTKKATNKISRRKLKRVHAKKEAGARRKDAIEKEVSVDRAGRLRKPHKEKAWQKVQAAPLAAAAMLKQAPHPIDLAGHKGLRKLLGDAKLISEMSLGKHGAQRTPVPKLRQAIGRLQANSRFLPKEAQSFVNSVASGMLDHLGCVNTDKSFKPFAIVLVAVLQLAILTGSAQD